MGFQNSNINLSVSINDNSCDYYGCMDQLAYNYSSWANIDDGSCEYLGCTHPDYLEYNPIATIEDGSCQTLIIWGCTETWADNYDELAIEDDGSCYRIGCTETWADNYDELATVDDSSCYLIGCIETWADNYDSIATVGDSSCYRMGCTQSWAINYDEIATIDNGNCVSLEYCNQIEIFDDFDNYNTDNYLQLESDSLWTTWNNYSNNIEDIFVSNYNSYSNENCLNLTSGNYTDIVLPLGDHNTGVWEISFMMRIEQENGAYFNLLHDFDANASNWAVEFNFNSNGTGYIEPSGVSDSLIISFQYPINTWFEVKN